MSRHTTLTLAGLLILGACLGADKDEKSSGTGDADDTGELQPITYPSGDRILMYTGHGGYEEDTTGKGGLDDVDARWKAAFGWNTDLFSSLPEDLSPYRAIFLVAPGSDRDAEFEQATVQQLKQALQAGSRIVILGEKSMCNASGVADLLDKLGTGITFTGEDAGENRLIDADSLTSELQVNEGVEVFRYKEPCWVDPGSGTSVGREDSRNHLGAVERPGRGGDVVVMGNFEFLDDGGLLEYGDNGVFADNLVKVEPSAE